MRSKVRLSSCVALAIACGAALIEGLFACGVPSSFDNLVGGPVPDAGDGAPLELRPDPSLKPPRPIAPLSTSWINGTRARFRWQLEPNTIGARVEVCRDRACATEKKTFEAGGPEIFPTEELAPGVWFWRLYSKTAETIGTTPSPTWEVFIRGGAEKEGRPSGTIVDFNGDGRPDLFLSLISVERGGDAGVTFVEVAPYIGGVDGTTFTLDEEVFGPGTSSKPGAAVAATDVNGDGLTDLVVNDELNSVFGVSSFPGSVELGVDVGRGGRASTAPLDELPNVRELGDFDGDGYGDIAVTTRRDARVLRGTPGLLGSSQFLFTVPPFLKADAGTILPSAPIQLGAGMHRDDDGFADGVFFWPFKIALGEDYPSTVAFVFGGSTDLGGLFPWPTGKLTGASAFASGDLDGDGLDDTAFATKNADGKDAICVILSKAEPQFDASADPQFPCWVPDPPPVGFASALVAADVDADGRDDILVGSTSSGVDLLRFQDGSLVATHITTEYGASITTIWPGRPGPAIWAATRAVVPAPDVGIFKGTEQAQVIGTVSQTSGFGPALR